MSNRFSGARNCADLITVDDESLLARYYGEVTTSPVLGVQPPKPYFEPAWAFPALDDDLRAFLSPATAKYELLPEYNGVSLRILDLRRNPATQTTKTFASLLIVARAVEHLRRTGEAIILFTPSSGNKAVALRDAVQRALDFGLATRQSLRIVTLTPERTIDKLRRSGLSEDPELLALNPVGVLPGDEPEAVKEIGANFVREFSLNNRPTTKLWATLNLDNYRQADQVRAFADYEFGAASVAGLRLIHAHAVSSAFGLLGYQAGLDRLVAMGHAVNQPGYLLVQHLGTCDMVLHSYFGSFDRSRVPAFRERGGEWVQDEVPIFPQRTWSPSEVLEETFYTRRPVTASHMSRLISDHGGGGIVVSLSECLQRYSECRELLESTDVSLPDDPRKIREWSMVMALTGVLNAIDRGVVRDVDGVVVHASGTYAVGDYDPLPVSAMTPVTSAADLHDLLS